MTAAGEHDVAAETAAGPGGGPGGGDGPGRPVPPAPASRGPRVGVIAALIAVVGVLLLGAGLLVSAGDDDDTRTADQAEGGEDEGWHGALLGEPQPRPEFTLTDTEGRPYDFAAETEGRLTLLFFGYTSCPDICPIQMATLSAALEQPSMPQPVVVFVSTDPERDTPEKLRSWLDQFGTDFVGLRGTADEVKAAEEAAQVPPSVLATEDGAAPEAGEDYEVGHAAQVIAYTPDDLAHVVYPFGVRRQDWQADLPRLMEQWGTAEAGEETGDGPAAGGDAGDAADETTVVAGDLTISGGWAAANDEITAAYLSIDNGGAADRLEAVSSDVAGSVHLMSNEAMAADQGDGAASDRPAPLEVPPGTTALAPGGWHIMLEDLDRPLTAGERVTLRLTFAEAGDVEVGIDILNWDEVADRAGTDAEEEGR